jgi:hypothetical protein
VDHDDYVIDEEVEYNKGDLYFQPFTTQRGTETRLLVHRKDIGVKTRYNIKHYEGACYHHNMKRTTEKFINRVTNDLQDIGPPDLLMDWDSTAFYYVFLTYVRMKGLSDIMTQEEVVNHCNSIVRKIGIAMNNKTFESLANLRSQEVPISSKKQVQRRQTLSDKLNFLLRVNPSSHHGASDE